MRGANSISRSPFTGVSSADRLRALIRGCGVAVAHGAALAALKLLLTSARGQAALREGDGWYHALMETFPESILVTDLAGVIVTVNRRATELFGCQLDEIVGMNSFDLVVPEAREDARRDFEGSRGSGVRQYSMLRRDGSSFPAEISGTRITDGKGKPSGYISLMRDISEQVQLEEQLRHQALHDALTGLPNRLLLRDRLEQLILSGHRDHTQFALLLMDLDSFKEINDTFGHHYGDLLLQEVGARLRHTLRESDTVARLGGDEFALLLPSVDEKGAVLTAARALTALAQGFVVEGQSLEVEASVGIVCYPEHGEDVNALLQRADVAMYAAKGTKGWYAVYAPQQDQHTPSRLALMGELRRAIDYDELVLHYQPKVDLKTGRISSVEALVRWQHPHRGLIPPSEFIPLAERTTLMNPLTMWVLNEALRQCRLWHDMGIDIRVQVNLSARMRDPELIERIAELVDTWGLSADRLGVEITEGAIMTDPEGTLEILARLREMGVFICVDDFGTGYSSLAYLQRLPVEEIKIDRSFVKDMVRNANDCSIVQATVSLVHDLGKRTVAEGVEDQETRDLLVELGCDLAQGYYLSRPLPAGDLTPWLQKHRSGEGIMEITGP